MKERVEYLDIFKGFLIILTIIGHSPFCPSQWIIFIYSFHMIAFFAAYGGVYDLKRHCIGLNDFVDFKCFVVKRAKRLLVPYIIWALIYNSPEWENILLILYGSSETLTKAGGLSSLWYLPCMFVAVVMFEGYIYLVVRKQGKEIKKIYALFFLALLMVSIGFILPVFRQGDAFFGFQAGTPWGVRSAFMACGFIAIGWLMNGVAMRIRRFDCRAKLLICFLAMSISFFALRMTCNTNMNYITTTHHVALSRASYGNPLLFLLDAGCGIVGILALSLIVEECFSRHLKWVRNGFCTIGANTMGIFLLHKRIVMRLGKIVSEHNGSGIKWMFVIVVFAIMISFVLTMLIKNVIPELIGEEKRERN